MKRITAGQPSHHHHHHQHHTLMPAVRSLCPWLSLQCVTAEPLFILSLFITTAHCSQSKQQEAPPLMTIQHAFMTKR